MVLKYWTGYIHTGIFGIHPDTTGSRPRSLRGLAAIFLQKRLDKEQRLSDWQQSSLTQAGTSNNKDQWKYATILRIFESWDWDSRIILEENM